jgi:H+/Cl- antiporter ClcA
VLVAAGCVATLRLPLASVMIASLLCAKAGLTVTPLIVVAVVVAYLISETLTAYVDARIDPDRGSQSPAGQPAASS